MIKMALSLDEKMEKEIAERLRALRLFDEMYKARQTVDSGKMERFRETREIYKEKALKFIKSGNASYVGDCLSQKCKELNLTQEELEKANSRLRAYISLLGEDFCPRLSKGE